MRNLLVSAVIAMSLTVTSMAVADEAAAPTYAPEKTAAPVVDAPAKPAVAAVTAPAKPAAPTAPVVAAVAKATAKSTTAAVAAPAKETTAAVAANAPPAAAASDAPHAAPPPAKDAKEPEPPLALRPPTPLALASEPAPTPWIYKLAFGAAILAAGVILWKRRRTLGSKRNPATAIRVLGKTAMGLRGELALVEVGGMRLVVGITSSSMQTLAILPDDYVLEDAAADTETTRAMELVAAAGSEASKPRVDLATRARSLFGSLDLGPPDPLRGSGASAFSASRYADSAGDDAPESAPAPRARPRDVRETRSATAQLDERTRRPVTRDARDAPLEGQARGIALALRNRR